MSHIQDTNVHVTQALQSQWNAKYNKPTGGIPKTDLASDIQTSLVPSSLSSDAGKVLTVNSSGDAVWAEATSSGSSGLQSFLVTFTQVQGALSFTADKTYAEIVAAHEAGKIVRCSVDLGVFGDLVFVATDSVVFRAELFEQQKSGFVLFSIFSNNEVNFRILSEYFPEYYQRTILASNWSDGVYSFENDFPSDNYDIEIELNSTATVSQVEAWISAKVTSVFGTNTMKALGDVPTVDIPVIVKAV